MVRASFALVLFFALSANAQTVSVPHVFANGQRADANQVNQNFQSLAEASTALASRVSAIEEQRNGSDGGGEESIRSRHVLSYDYIETSPGENVEVGRETLEMVRVPVQVPNGHQYLLDLPVGPDRIDDSDGAPAAHEVRMSLRHRLIGQRPAGQEFVVGDAVASIAIFDSHEYTITRYDHHSLASGQQAFSVSCSSSVVLSITLEEYLLVVVLDSPDISRGALACDSLGAYASDFFDRTVRDYSNEVELETIRDSTKANAIDMYIDYLRVKRSS